MSAGKEAATTSKRWDAKPSHKLLHTIITVIVTAVVVGGGVGAYWFFKQDTQTNINNTAAPAVVKTVVAPDAARAHFNEAVFSMDLPADWKRLQPDIGGNYNQYKYQSGKKNADNRYLSVYVDKLPLTMAVSREVAVAASGQGLTHGSVSDICTTFTTQPNARALITPARWDGVSFNCDMASKVGTVIGTSSKEAVNSVTVQNAGFTSHSFFFVYEDDNYTPDYGILYNTLSSFHVK